MGAEVTTQAAPWRNDGRRIWFGTVDGDRVGHPKRVRNLSMGGSPLLDWLQRDTKRKTMILGVPPKKQTHMVYCSGCVGIYED